MVKYIFLFLKCLFLTWGFPEYTDNENSELSWELGSWLSVSGKTFYFLTQNSGLDFSLTSLWAVGSSFHRGHSTLKVIDLYSSIHSNSLCHLGPRIYDLSLSGNKNQLPRLPRSKLLIPIQETLACISSWSDSQFFLHCGLVHFFFILGPLYFFYSTDIHIKQDSYFLWYLQC